MENKCASSKKEKILVTEVLKFSEPYRDCYTSSATTQTCTDRQTGGEIQSRDKQTEDERVKKKEHMRG